jgi:hypothetical protein
MNARKSNDDRSLFLASLNAVPVCKQRVADTDWFPAVDVSETGEEYLIEFDLPGLTPNLPRQLRAALKTFFAHAGATGPQPR